MSRLLKALVLLSLLAFCLSNGVFAYFSAQAMSTNNSLTAGTLYLGKDEDNKGILEGSMKLSKMFPGETPKEFKLTIKNVGDMKAYLNGLSSSVIDSDFKFMANAIRVTCSGPQGERLFTGSMLSLDNNAVPIESEVVIEPGEAKDLNLTFQLDHRAGNWYKGKNIEVLLTVYAGQESGQKLETNVVLADHNIQETIDMAEPKSVVLVSAGEYGKLHIKSSDIMIKAKDVVYDTVLSGIAITGQAQKVCVQGFTVDGKGRDNLVVIPDGAKYVTMQDNIFLNNRRNGKGISKDLKFGRSVGLNIQRNDFSALFDNPVQDGQSKNGNGMQVNISTDSSQLIRYNLGLDLDPSAEAL